MAQSLRASFTLAAVILLWGLLRLPAAARTAADWVRLVLDGATIMTASSLFAWYFAVEPLVQHRSQAVTLWVSVGAGLVCQVAVAAVAKVLLAGAGPVDPGALRVVCGGLFVGSFLAGFSALLAQHTPLDPSQPVFAPLALTAVLAADRQRRTVRNRAADTTPGRRRPFSVVPYIAVLATQSLLFFKIDDPRGRMPVVIGAVLVIGLVVVRQWGAFHQISRLLSMVRAQEERLRHQATHDGLTQLANRGLFADRLTVALGGRDATSAVLLIDLDDFKRVNDTFGHAAGDTLLVTVAERLSECVRPGDVAARFGGGEFAVLLAGTDEQHAAAVADRILARLAEPVMVDGHRLATLASVGVALSTGEDDPDTVLRHADLAMYQAKHGGKGGFSWHRPLAPQQAW